MSIDRIGPKVMIQKATDVARDVNNQQKQAELTKALLTKESQTQTDMLSQQVKDVYEPDQSVLQREKEKREKDKKGEKKSQQNAKDPQQGEDNTPEISQEIKKIDIRI
ncbi:hypothetical protein LJB83_03285 [Clostridia bacterium OttesenSCG-928-F22]|nr:hypothetical protein [Clostridia bacterium OttesenSCG-928-F22]